jgi:hypothetical protein
MRGVAVAARRAAAAWQWRPTRFPWIESQDGGALMIARVLEGEIDGLRMSLDDAVDVVRGSVDPALRDQEGYRGHVPASGR